MRKLALITVLLCMYGMARGQTDSYRYLYWFDADQATLHEGQSMTQQWRLSTDASGLSDALHTLYIMVIDNNGRFSQPVVRTFMKMNDDEGFEGYYWFDKNTTDVRQSPIVEGVFDVDASLLTDGFHSFSFQARRSDGSMTQPVERHFLKIAQTENVSYMTCVCSVDGEMFKEQRLPSHGGIIEWELDVSNLSFGIHRIQVQAVTPSGAATPVHDAIFLRTNTASELNKMHCIYSVDGKISGTEAGALGNGTYHFDIDMAQLTDGIHRLSYQLTDDKGISTALQTHFFVKNPVGGNGIIKYEYWINDLAEEPHKVVLNQPVTPYHLAALLPIESQPLRSSQFHFELKDGEPYIYAKNSLHVRFYDKTQRFTDTTEEYIDYAIGEAVTDTDELVPGERETIKKPAENAIKWYKLEAERGDSLRFRVDRACTMQLFAPSNKEVYNVSGSESVKWGGLHTTETGTFYLALHDVTATQGTTISLDYEHIDKYAVLRQDVSVVGDKEYSTITFEGNGFDELESVDLILGQVTIKSVEIKAEGKAQAAVKFCFDGAAHGEYRAEFHFAEGDIVRQKCIKVEEAIPYTFDVTAVYNKRFLISQHKTVYTFKVHNNSNVTAYNVPLMIRVYTESQESLNRIYIDGFDMKKHFMDIFGESDTESLNMYIDYKRAESGDRLFFLESDSTDIVDGWATHAFEAFVWPDLPPNSTKDITLSMELSEPVFCYMWFPDESFDYKTENIPAESTSLKTPRRSWQGVWEWIKGLMDIGNKNVKCVWAKNSEERDRWLFDNEQCSSRVLSKHYVSNGDCGGQPSPSPVGPGGPSNPVKSLDPNEIYGYEAESGSKAIKDGLTDVSYTIQFENDTTFATAAAHDIWVRDTLDANRFDLSTYKPTKVKIGNKEMDLDGSPNFIVTMGMQPEINAVAQIEGTFDEKTGIVCWHLSSLDPMTVEPTDDVMAGILPVNFDGQGIGEVSFDISLKPDIPHGTEIPNRAAIIFDTNDVIMTPTWTNAIDRVKPVSRITKVEQVDGGPTATVSIEATDEGSGPWRYDVYVQYGSGAWFLAAENVAAETTATVKVYEDMVHHFYCVATDMAGNVEQKEPATEASLTVGTVVIKGDLNGDSVVNAADVWTLMGIIACGGTAEENPRADVNRDGRIDIGDVNSVIAIMAQ